MNLYLYHWDNSSALRQYSDGNIFVVAEDLTRAIEIALADWDTYATEGFWLNPAFEDDAKELSDLRARLVVDLSSPPAEIRAIPCAAFVKGSN